MQKLSTFQFSFMTELANGRVAFEYVSDPVDQWELRDLCELGLLVDATKVLNPTGTAKAFALTETGLQLFSKREHKVN